MFSLNSDVRKAVKVLQKSRDQCLAHDLNDDQSTVGDFVSSQTSSSTPSTEQSHSKPIFNLQQSNVLCRDKEISMNIFCFSNISKWLKASTLQSICASWAQSPSLDNSLLFSIFPYFHLSLPLSPSLFPFLIKSHLTHQRNYILFTIIIHSFIASIHLSNMNRLQQVLLWSLVH